MSGAAQPAAPVVKVLIVDDHPSVRRGLCALLLAHGARYQVVGEAGSVDEAEAVFAQHPADLLITDLHMKPLDGLVLIQRLKPRAPELRCVVFTAEGNPERARRALQAGAHGVVLKEADEAEVLRCLEAVVCGAVHLPAEWAQALSQPEPARPHVTLRERDVLGCIAEGLTNKEIARRLGMEPRTVESHRANIMRRFELASSAQLGKFAVERRWD